MAGVLLGEALLYVGVAMEPALVFPAFAVHAATFVACVTGPLWYDDATPASNGLFFTFSLLPLSRLVLAGLPRLSDVGVARVAILYGVIAPAVLLVARLDGTPTPEPGWEDLLRVGPFFVPLVAVLGGVMFLFLRPAGLVPAASPTWLAFGALLFVGIVGPVEELLFRGLLQDGVRRHAGGMGAVVISGVLFGALHSQYGSFPTVLVAVLVGVLLGFLYHRTGSLALVGACNGVMRFCTFVALPLFY